MIPKIFEYYKLEIKMKQDEGNIALSSWEVTDYMDILTKSYYKNELINTLKLYDFPKNFDIIIFDDSFSLKTKYTDLNTIDINSYEGAKRFFHLGAFTSLTPNIRTFRINMLFEMFLKVNEILVKENFKRMDKNKLSKLIANCLSDGVTNNDISELVYSELTRTLKLSKLSDKADASMKQKDSESRKKVITNTKNNLGIILLKYQNFEKNESNFENVLKLMKENSIFRQNDISNSVRSYYKRFNELFNRLQRPIIGVLDYDKNEIDIICSDFIDKDKYTLENPNFFDIKEITRNSPLSLTFFLGLGACTIFWQILNIKNDTKLLEEYSDNVNKKSEEKITYIKNEFDSLSNQTGKALVEQTERYDFLNEKSDITIIKIENKAQ